MPIPIIILLIIGVVLFIVITYALAIVNFDENGNKRTEQTQIVHIKDDKVVIKQTQNGKGKSKTIVRTDKPITIVNETNSNSNSDLP